MIFKAPEYLMSAPTSFCQGCGHGVIGRIMYEVIEEMNLSDKVITVLDVACCSLFMYSSDYDYVGTAHGRVVPTACGVKRVRKDNPVIAYHGDGAAYSIGMAHTIWAAIRNENITCIVVNNQVFGMTGGQMSPTSLIDQKTTSSPLGRNASLSGEPFDIMKTLDHMNVAYLARGSVDKPANIAKTKQYIKKGIENQMNNKGFSLVEILSPCPTNWNLSPLDSVKRMQESVIPVFPLGEFIKAGGK